MAIKNIGIWKRYEAYGLEIEASLASGCHEFRFQNHDIKILLPKRPKQSDWHSDKSPIKCRTYRERGNRKYPLVFQIYEVDVIINCHKKRKVKEEAIGNVNVSLFTKRERASLDKMTFKYEEILDAAFEYWKNILRWCVEQPTIFQLTYKRHESSWGSYLIDLDSEKRFYRPPSVYVVPASKPIKMRDWKKAQQFLLEGKYVPIWQLYYFEAHERSEIGDTRGYIISLAISLETIIRYLTKDFLKEPINQKYQSIVNSISISRLIDSWPKLGFVTSDWKKITEERKIISQLFQLRNGIMHRGENPQLTKTEKIKYGNAAKTFIKTGEKIANQ